MPDDEGQSGTQLLVSLLQTVGQEETAVRMQSYWTVVWLLKVSTVWTWMGPAGRGSALKKVGDMKG